MDKEFKDVTIRLKKSMYVQLAKVADRRTWGNVSATIREAIVDHIRNTTKKGRQRR